MPDDVPEKVDEIIRDLGIYVPPDATSPEMQAFYERALSGECMTCGAECGKNTWIAVGQPEGLDRVVVVMMFCGGACASDMQVLGYLQEQHEDIVQKVQFRGGQGGN